MYRVALMLSSIIVSAIFLLTAFNYHDTYAAFPIKTSYHHLTPDVKREVDCMAENMYFEALNEGKTGLMAVAFVTLNRLHTGNYSDSICGVVKQRTARVCQFSWYCDTNFLVRRPAIIYTKEYEEIRDLALYVILNYKNLYDVTYGATFYHADYVNPGWKLEKTIKIGRHIFYKHDEDIRLISKGIES